jgi:hypothetical protein
MGMWRATAIGIGIFLLGCRQKLPPSYEVTLVNGEQFCRIVTAKDRWSLGDCPYYLAVPTSEPLSVARVKQGLVVAPFWSATAQTHSQCPPPDPLHQVADNPYLVHMPAVNGQPDRHLTREDWLRLRSLREVGSMDGHGGSSIDYQKRIVSYGNRSYRYHGLNPFLTRGSEETGAFLVVSFDGVIPKTAYQKDITSGPMHTAPSGILYWQVYDRESGTELAQVKVINHNDDRIFYSVLSSWFYETDVLISTLPNTVLGPDKHNGHFIACDFSKHKKRAEAP